MADVAANALPTRAASRRPGLLRRLLRHRSGIVALVILVPMYLVCFLGPLLYTVSPTATNPRLANLAPGTEHLLGTDELGRDEFARLIHGGRVTLSVGLISMLVAVVIGLLIGGIAAYFGGLVETALMRIIDMFLAIPPLFLILVLLTVLGNDTGTVILVVGVSFWASVARVVYADVLRFRNADHIEATRALGAGHVRIMLRHLAPQVFPGTVVLGTLVVAWSILTSAALSFIGLGIQPPTPSWGNMLQNSQSYIWLDPKLAVLPGIAISATVLSFNLLGNALRDVLDPRGDS